ncbi:MAG TPA: hypothetical protein VGH23_02610 [Rhizomicrobium sp.]
MDVQATTSMPVSMPQSGSLTAVPSSSANQSQATVSSTPADPTDTITLSAAAQQALANGSSTAATTATATSSTVPVGKYDSQFTSLSAIITDTSGQYSQEQQLQAYTAFTTLASNAGVDSRGYGQGPTEAQYEAVNGSAIGAQARSLQQQMALSMSAGMNADPNGGADRAANQFFSSLSAFQQNVVFQGANMKLPNQSQLFGNVTQYADFLSTNAATAGAKVSSANTADLSTLPPSAFASLTSSTSKTDPVTLFAQSVLQLFTNPAAASN